jgi:hypothetical protein
VPTVEGLARAGGRRVSSIGPWVQPPLRVEQMRDEGRTCICCGEDLVVGRIAVPDGDAHTGRDQLSDRSKCTRSFRGEGEVRHGPIGGIKQLLMSSVVGSSNRSSR